MRVTAGKQPLCVEGKQLDDLIDGPATIEWTGITGNVTAKLKHIEGWEEFNPTNATEQEGHFFAITLDAAYTGKPVTVRRADGTEKTATDRNWILRVPDTGARFTFIVDGKIIFILTFAGATLEA